MTSLRSPQIVLALVTLSSLFGPAGATEAGWAVADRIGTFHVVTMTKRAQGAPEKFWEALRAVCKTSHCNVLFLDQSQHDEISMLTELDATRRALLVYTTNSGFAWNCQFRPYADNCFAP